MISVIYIKMKNDSQIIQIYLNYYFFIHELTVRHNLDTF